MVARHEDCHGLVTRMSQTSTHRRSRRSTIEASRLARPEARERLVLRDP
jgi:hypothetical protein